MAESSHYSGFTNAHRHIVDEDEIKLTSVGVDIGSSTSHLVFSRLELRQEGMRYVVVRREILNESEILLTPYVDEATIDVATLGKFINRQYERAGLSRNDVDTGALILTGVAVRRRNARAIGELFAEEAGRFVAVSAGDSLESTMAAYGSGAVLHSRRNSGVFVNVDIGGGTSKIAVCEGGRVREVTAIDVGARLVVLDGSGVVSRLEEAGRYFGAAAGLELAVGKRVERPRLSAMVSLMADRLFEAIGSSAIADETRRLLRIPPLSYKGTIDGIVFSGGVSEFIYDQNPGDFGDLGALLAAEVKKRVQRWGIPVLEPTARIRATVIGASQYTIQVSGSTIFIEPLEAVPVRNVPVVVPDLPLEQDEIDQRSISDAVVRSLEKLDLNDGRRPVALGFQWEGSATFARLQAFCSGIAQGLEKILARGHPLMLVNSGDVGGIIGLHFKEEMKVESPVISIDGISLSEFDYIDIGALIPSSGAVPVVVKSLIFPSSP
ncbi:MAG TPA: ethanolamine ammonia-lyase reactivating factor EutA [Candidatus Acidoferrales bacterium]|nr:ethanolamine ammonia-lyase reactivating factor EutA [Candidatus Acidoferrales bacterium]